MSQPVNLANSTYDRLKFMKEKAKHKSFTTAIDELLTNYWSPQMEAIQIEEQFDALIQWLRIRNLETDNTIEAILRAKGHVIHAKKQKRLEHGQTPQF